AVGQAAVARQTGHGVTAREMHRTAVARGRVAAVVDGRHRETEGRASGPAARGAEHKVRGENEFVGADVDRAIRRPGLQAERIEVFVDRGQVVAIDRSGSRAGVDGRGDGRQVVVVTGRVDEAGVVGDQVGDLRGAAGAGNHRAGAGEDVVLKGRRTAC